MSDVLDNPGHMLATGRATGNRTTGETRAVRLVESAGYISAGTALARAARELLRHSVMTECQLDRPERWSRLLVWGLVAYLVGYLILNVMMALSL